MVDIEIQEVEDFRRPSRKPWLLLAVLLLIGGYMVYRHFGPERERAAPPSSVEKDSFKGQGATARVAATASHGGVKAGADLHKGSTSGHSSAGAGEKGRHPETVAGSTGKGEVSILLNEGRLLEGKDDLAGARERYFAVLASNAGPGVKREAEARLGAIHIAMVFSSRSMPEKEDYLVKKGDFLLRIAQQHGTTVDLITVSNGLKSGAMIKAGDLLRVLKAKFRVAVSTGGNDLLLMMNDRFFKRYQVGTGKDEKTPHGTFVIASKEKEPVWWPQGREIPYGHPENILGTRWMALRATGETPDVRGYGIHGTWDDSSIGKSVSAGCVRMRNKDVEELFTIVTLGVPVTITE